MARYRKVEMQMHSDAKVMGLSRPKPSGYSLWCELLIGPQTGLIPGVQCIGRAAFAEQLGWEVEDFTACFNEIASQGMATADWKARLIWLPNAIKHNEPANPKQVAAWHEAWSLVPNCPLKDEAGAAIRAYLETRGKRFVQAFEAGTIPNLADTETVSETISETKSRNSPAKPEMQPEPRNQESGSRSQEAGGGFAPERGRAPAPPPSRPSAGEQAGQPAEPFAPYAPGEALPPMDADVGDGRVPPMGGWYTEHDAAAGELLDYLNTTWGRKYTLAANRTKLIAAVKARPLDELKAAVDLIAAKLASDRIGIEPLMGTPAKLDGWVEQAKAAKPKTKTKPAGLAPADWKTDDILTERPQWEHEELLRREPDITRWPDYWLSTHPDQRDERDRRRDAKHPKAALRAVSA